MSRGVDTPSQGGGSNQDLNLASNKKALACGSVPISQTSMVHANAKLQSVAQVWILQTTCEFMSWTSIQAGILI